MTNKNDMTDYEKFMKFFTEMGIVQEIEEFDDLTFICTYSKTEEEEIYFMFDNLGKFKEIGVEF